ncbi:MAG: hypothetical protein EOO94_04605 [Pedobacter sp.]|nr:MAG: hypothetical protein EOO94_04605 [Pedobacter sp.]
MNTTNNLAQILADMYANAPRNQLVTNIHLFGISYNQEIRQAGVRDVVAAAGIPSTYVAEVNKGINLAAYVVPLRRHTK